MSLLSTTLTGSMEAIHVGSGVQESAPDKLHQSAGNQQPETIDSNGDTPNPEGHQPTGAGTENDSSVLNTAVDSSTTLVDKSHSSHSHAHQNKNSTKSAVGGTGKCPNKNSPSASTAKSDVSESKSDNSIPRTVSVKRKREAEEEGGKRDVKKETKTATITSAQNSSESSATGSAAAAQGRGTFFVKDWEFVQILGEGAYGEVKLAYNIITREAVAVKIVDTSEEGVEFDEVRKEVCIHRMISHKNVIKFYGVRREGDTQYLFLEYASGGELFDRIEPDIGMPQAEAQKYFRQLIDGLEYLHSKGIAHRDIKPENLLLDENDDLKIADFGLATIFRYQDKWRHLDRLCGSAPYLAPEVVNGKPYRAEPADIWSCGIVFVAMLGGGMGNACDNTNFPAAKSVFLEYETVSAEKNNLELPWDAAVLACIEYVNWRECHIENKPWSKIDNLALCLLRRLLVEKPEKRYTVADIRKNQWFNKNFSKDRPSQLSEGPFRLRTRSSESEHSPGPVSCSQPIISRMASGPESMLTGGNAEEDGATNPISFSQPVQADNMLLSSQLNGTQSSQTPMQKLVRRMTRFFSKQSLSEVTLELDRVFTLLGYTWKQCSPHVLTVHTTDRRQSRLTFKAMLLEMGESLLVDFRLSKGDGLEFKRHFIRIREHMKSVICKVPPSWPNLPCL